jgi:nucleoside-diphosphate-sugar epimerase
MYAITGITGKVGGELARTLLAAGQPVRAVVRDASLDVEFYFVSCWFLNFVDHGHCRHVRPGIAA